MDENQTCVSCPRCDKLFFVNISTGEIVKGKCNTYRCEFCGYRKARRLQNALKDYFIKFKIIRLWTFTITDQLINHFPENDKFKMFSEIWRRFLNNIRRDKRLTKSERNFQYVKVLELQKQGNPHYHVFFDRWVSREVVNDVWERLLIQLYQSGFTYNIDDESEFEDEFFVPEKNITKFGNAYVESNIDKKTGAHKYGFTPAQASSYITKYLMKTIKDLASLIKARVWTKSSRVRLFPFKALPSPWTTLQNAERLLYLYSLRATSPSETGQIVLIDHNYCTLDNYIGNTS